jgi:CMP-N-acetylneuraminic acid synthetase
MKTVGIIFARGGSKGLPRKNIRNFYGKPLIAWSIEIALSIKRIDRVIVSTDSEEIAQIAKQYGAEVPFLRPIHLATDDSSEWDSWRHALDFLSASKEGCPKTIVSLPATAPLRSLSDVNNCIDKFERCSPDIVITYTDAHRNPYFNMVKSKESGDLGLVIQPDTKIYRRQDAPQIYDMTTVAYVASSSFVLNKKSLFEGSVLGVYIPPERAIDIDTALDFEFAEFLMKKNYGSY